MSQDDYGNDIARVTQLIMHEREAKDRGWWDEMHSCYHDDSRVRLSWIDASGHEFVEQSRQMYDSGSRPVHRMASPAVHLNEERGVVEAPAVLESRIDVGGVEVDRISYLRVIYRVEREAGVWRIRAMDCIYERDAMIPVVPGSVVELDQALLAQFRPSYRFLAYNLTVRGRTLTPDLYGDDEPEGVAELYATVFGWLGRPVS